MASWLEFSLVLFFVFLSSRSLSGPDGRGHFDVCSLDRPPPPPFLSPAESRSFSYFQGLNAENPQYPFLAERLPQKEGKFPPPFFFFFPPPPLAFLPLWPLRSVVAKKGRSGLPLFSIRRGERIVRGIFSPPLFSLPFCVGAGTSVAGLQSSSSPPLPSKGTRIYGWAFSLSPPLLLG